AGKGAGHAPTNLIVIGEAHDLLKEAALLHVGESEEDPAPLIVAPTAGVSPGKSMVDIVVAVASERKLLEVIGALRAVGRFSDLLHGRQKQANEHGNDGNYHQELDQGKGLNGPSESPLAKSRHYDSLPGQ